MVDSTAACDRGRAWPSRSRTQGAALGGAKGKPEELALRARTAPFGRSMRSAMRVIRVCGVVESTIYAPGVGATSVGSPPGAQWASGDGGVSRRYHSASSAPMQPVPAAVTAWR